jgi:hypothetical protein
LFVPRSISVRRIVWFSHVYTLFHRARLANYLTFNIRPLLFDQLNVKMFPSVLFVAAFTSIVLLPPACITERHDPDKIRPHNAVQECIRSADTKIFSRLTCAPGHNSNSFELKNHAHCKITWRFLKGLRGGRSKRGGKRVKAALEDAQSRGSNSTAGARYPVGRWASLSRNNTNMTEQTQGFVQSSERSPWTKKKPLSNRQLANQARNRHRHVGFDFLRFPRVILFIFSTEMDWLVLQME